ncbi:MAG: glycosyltransferase family 4 protein [Nitrospirae bacterium]|nr:glycosyltransferase family 4 protein [Nitrospirota bacterium]
MRISGDLIVVIGKAVNRAAFEFTIDTSAKKRELGLDPESKNIVCVGNLRQGKGHEYLLDAFEKLSLKRFPGVNLLIAGDGQMSRTLLSQVKSYTSQANIHFLGNRDDIAEILKISDIFVLPTLYEGMSNAILEAMASKVAVITTDIPVNIELVGDTAIVVPVRNPDTLAEAMQTLLLNDALREDLAQRAYAKITSQYSLEVIVERYITLIKAIINA